MARDIKFKFLPDADAAVRENAKLTNQIDRLKQKMREVGRESKSAGQTGRSAFANADHAVVGLIGSLVSGNSLRSSLQSIQEEFRKTAEEGLKSISALQGTVAGAGDIAVFTDVKGALRGMSGAGAAQLTMNDRTAIYGAARGADPHGSLAGVLEITDTAAQAMVIHGSVEESKRMAALMARIRRAAPGTSTGDLADLATFLPQAAGEHVQELDKMAFKGVRQLVNQGMSGDEAFGFMLAAMESEQGARALSSYASYRARGGTGTLEPAAATMLDQAKRRDYGSMVRRAREGDVFKSQVATASREPEILGAIAQRTAKAELSLAEFDESLGAMFREAGLSSAEATWRRQGVSAPVRSKMRWTEEWAATISGGDAPPMAASPEVKGAWLQAGIAKALREATREGVREGMGRPTLGPSTLEEKVGP